MSELVRSLVAVLETMAGGLEQLTALARRKIGAVERDDLLALDEVMNQEQALALSFRGLEQKREHLLRELGLGGTPISQLAGRCPPDMQAEMRRTVDRLQAQYREYRASADQARSALEHDLHEIERALADMGATPVEAGPGYTAREAAAPPPSMKTDFRA